MRSLLFVPADSERKLARGLQSGADALILDLEDSVAAANRPVARVKARQFLAAQPTISADDVLAKCVLDFRQRGMPRLNDLAGEEVRVHHGDAAFTEQLIGG